MKKIRFGSRKSALALAQTRLIMEAVKKAHPEYTLELVPMITTGDVNMKPFSEASDKFGIKGLFTQELEEALLRGDIDIAVHSLKDVPAVQDPRLPLVAYYHRDDPRDAMALPSGCDSFDAAAETVIGCSSARRRLQVLELFKDIEVRPVRGNVGTRLKKLDDRQFSALILAAAGLKRLGMENRIARYFSIDEIIPAPGQGILACQGRAGDEYDEWLSAIADADTTDCAVAERTFSIALGGGCASPVGACARLYGNELKLSGFFADESKGFKCRDSIAGPRSQARELAEQLAKRVLEKCCTDAHE